MAEDKYLFQKLTPVHDADISVYEEAIDYAFENSDVTNIAISGAYSAGKSSILESYKGKHKNYKFVHISLAHFKSADSENEEEDTVKESVLEGKILNQLIHQIPADKIPQTNFRVKKEVSGRNVRLLTLLICLLVGSFTFLLFSNELIDCVADLQEGLIKNVLSGVTSIYAIIIAIIICIACSWICIYSIVKIQKNKNIFHKISVQGNEIEIFESQDDSYFDKYLNEVLYLFESIDADVIVFEDMDRFNVNRIFERLREVNNLTNIQRKNKKENEYKPLRFFYLLRDDIFITKDRTKFFDYIVPIIPVLDGSNSYEQFTKQLKAAGLISKFDTGFLQRLSLYIDDMRVLKNIYNEFIVYMYRLNNTDLNWDKMLAIIVYKNIFPRDFCDLQLAKGYVHELFENKPSLFKSSLKDLNDQKQKMVEEIDRIKSETLNSIEELNDAYNVKYSRLPKQPYNNSRLSAEGEKQKIILEQEKELRSKAIQDKLEERLPEHEKELAELEREIVITKTKLLSELVTRNNLDAVFMISSKNAVGEENVFKEIKGSDYFELLKFLIRYGYIDETYNDYMTYFYEESLSANDKAFLRRITDRRGADYEYPLKEVQKVIASPVLRVVDFCEEETMNYDLLTGILANQGIDVYQKYLSTFIEQLKDKKSIDFISKYYDSKQFVEEFVIKLNELWSGFFSYIVKNKAMATELVRRYSIDTLYLSDEETLLQVNADGALANYISSSEDYMNIDNPQIEKIIANFELLGVLFKSINFDKSNRTLFDAVYKSSLYELTYENIELMLVVEYAVTNKEDVIHKNYSLIQSDQESSLAKYIAENISMYISIIIDRCAGSISDDEPLVIALLNNEDIETEKKIKYIDLLITKITDLSSINDTDLWTELLKADEVLFSVANFVNYYKVYGLASELIKYLNGTNEDMDFTVVKKEFGDEVAERLFDSISITNEIDTDKYKKILNDLGYQYDQYSEDNLANDKLEVLINEQILDMSVEGLRYIREKYQNSIMTFITKNIDKYLNIQSADTFVLEEAVQVIELDIDDTRKLELLEYTNNPIKIVGKSLSDDIQAHILLNNCCMEEEQQLYQHYSEFGEKTQNEIVSIAISRVVDIIQEGMVIDDALISKLLTSSLSMDVKVEFFNTTIARLNEDTCKKHFEEMELSELCGIFTKRNTTSRTYEKSDYVTMIFEALKKHTWISDYYETGENKDRYIVVKNPPRSKAPDFLD